MSRLPILLSVLAVVFHLGCEDSPTEIESETALFKKGGKPGGGGSGPAAPEIAFRSNGALRVMNADGSHSTLVVPESQFAGSSAWSPLGDGSGVPYQIVFELGGGPLATIDITTPADGGIVATVPDTIVATKQFSIASYPAWSPDGSRIAFQANLGETCANGEGQGESDIWTMDSDGSNPTRLTHNCDNYIFANDPSWAPDGSAIAYKEEGGGTTTIKIIHLSDGYVETVFDAADPDDDISTVRDGPDWSRVGTQDKLAFTAIRHYSVGKKGTKSVYSVYTLTLQKDASGHYSAAGSPEFEIDGRRPSWSPDATRFVMDGVTVYDVGTGETTRLANGDIASWRR
jgi:Tol biopolymer transport system component